MILKNKKYVKIEKNGIIEQLADRRMNKKKGAWFVAGAASPAISLVSILAH